MGTFTALLGPQGQSDHDKHSGLLEALACFRIPSISSREDKTDYEPDRVCARPVLPVTMLQELFSVSGHLLM